MQESLYIWIVRSGVSPYRKRPALPRWYLISLQNRPTNMGRPPNALARLGRSQKVPILRIRGAARPKNPGLRKRDRRQGFRLRTTPSAAGRAQGDLFQKLPSPAATPRRQPGRLASQ
jgi:hypothetical protein